MWSKHIRQNLLVFDQRNGLLRNGVFQILVRLGSDNAFSRGSIMRRRGDAFTELGINHPLGGIFNALLQHRVFFRFGLQISIQFAELFNAGTVFNSYWHQDNIITG
ncbi:hypothetical protein D3C76_1492030 [compost metagenome]